MQARLKTGLSCPWGPPPDAVHVSSKLVDPEPVQNTQNFPAAADTRSINVYAESTCTVITMLVLGHDMLVDQPLTYSLKHSAV